jgi:hypothetical protein
VQHRGEEEYHFLEGHELLGAVQPLEVRKEWGIPQRKTYITRRINGDQCPNVHKLLHVERIVIEHEPLMREGISDNGLTSGSQFSKRIEVFRTHIAISAPLKRRQEA